MDSCVLTNPSMVSRVPQYEALKRKRKPENKGRVTRENVPITWIDLRIDPGRAAGECGRRRMKGGRGLSTLRGSHCGDHSAGDHRTGREGYGEGLRRLEDGG